MDSRSSAPASTCAHTGRAKALAWPSATTLAVFVLVAAAALGADLATKHVVFRDFLAASNLDARVAAIIREYPRPVPPLLVLHQLDLHRPLGAGLRLTMSVNPGVVFGWDLPRWLVLAATAGTTVIVLAMLLTSPRRGALQVSAIALVFAGAMGNLYDRLFSCVQLPFVAPIRYHVRDFIDASQLHYPYIFNVADVWLVVGVGYLLLRSLWPHPKRPDQQK